jgi:hypothetical protein
MVEFPLSCSILVGSRLISLYLKKMNFSSAFAALVERMFLLCSAVPPPFRKTAFGEENAFHPEKVKSSKKRLFVCDVAKPPPSSLRLCLSACASLLHVRAANGAVAPHTAIRTLNVAITIASCVVASWWTRA